MTARNPNRTIPVRLKRNESGGLAFDTREVGGYQAEYLPERTIGERDLADYREMVEYPMEWALKQAEFRLRAHRRWLQEWDRWCDDRQLRSLRDFYQTLETCERRLAEFEEARHAYEQAREAAGSGR
jgi:hypothetical protein